MSASPTVTVHTHPTPSKRPSQAPSPQGSSSSPTHILPGHETDTLEPAPESRGRARFRAQTQASGVHPEVSTSPKPNALDKGKGKMPASPRLKAAAPGPAPKAAEFDAAASGATQLSTVTELKNEGGVLSFLMHVPASKSGEPEQTYRISVMGGERADLALLNAKELAAHLTHAIALVQENPQTKGFSTITFQGRLDEDALAKAVVEKGSDTFVLGGNRRERVVGTERIFSEELQILLNRLQATLASRHSHTKIERYIPEDKRTTTTPPSTPMTALPKNNAQLESEEAELTAGRFDETKDLDDTRSSSKTPSDSESK